MKKIMVDKEFEIMAANHESSGDDPAYLRAKKEAWVALAAWAAAAIYVIGYYHLFGRNLDPDQVRTFWGVPSWVVGGVFVPWIAAIGFSAWYGLVFIQDEDFEGDEPEGDDA